MKSFATALRAEIKAAGHTQITVATLTGLPQSVISKASRDGNDPRLTTVIALLRVYPKLLNTIKNDAFEAMLAS